MSEVAASWILELRGRLAEPPPTPPRGRPSIVVVLPLLVEQGSLWTMLSLHEAAGEEQPFLGLPGAPLEAGEDHWGAVARIVAAELDIDPSRVLRLGQLDAVRGLDGSEILPCVVALPREDQEEETLSVPPGKLAAPLVAFESERPRALEVEGETRLFPRFLLPSREGLAEIWGPPASIFANLQARLDLR